MFLLHGVGDLWPLVREGSHVSGTQTSPGEKTKQRAADPFMLTSQVKRHADQWKLKAGYE